MTEVRVTSRIPQVRRQMRQAGEAGVQKAAEHLLEESNRTVPLEEGTLMRSGRADSEGLTAQVSYGTPYARVQHERTWYRHAGGRRAKWLQMTFQERSGQVQAWLALEIRKRVR